MSEYEAKRKQIEELAKWLNDNRDKIPKEDAIIISRLHKGCVTTGVVGTAYNIMGMLQHIAENTLARADIKESDFS